MKANELIQKIEDQFNIKIVIENSKKNWIYVRITREEQYKVMPYLCKLNIRYEKHLNNGFFIVLD